MKTAITKTIDGVEFVSGFDSAVLDPEGTKQLAKEWLSNDDDFKELTAEYVGKLNQKANEYIQYYNRCRIDRTMCSKSSYDMFLFEQYKIQEEIVVLARQIKKSRNDAFNANMTYFIPRLGERIIEDDYYTDLVGIAKNLKKNEYINMSGKKFQDNRGKVYYEKNNEDWHKKSVLLFGDKKSDDSFYSDELDEIQKKEIFKSKEKQRVKSLSEEARQAEINALNHVALHNAAIKMNEYELSNELNPKEKATEWLDEKKSEILDKYTQ